MGGWITTVEIVRTWTAIVPVKALDDAKSRLIHHADRAEWALAFALDTVRAATATTSVGQVVVISDDDRVRAALESADLSALILDDPGGGLNACLAQASRDIDGPIVMMLGDLPCLTATALESFLGFAATHRAAFVADAHGTGTTMLAMRTAVQPHFGERSCAAHTAAGYTHYAAAEPTLRRDVDDEIDLWDAVRIGVGPATHALLRVDDRAPTVHDEPGPHPAATPHRR